MKVNGSLHLIAGGQILNLRVENLANDPVTPYTGQVWFNSTQKVFKYYDGVAVKVIGTGGDISTLQDRLAATTNGDGSSMIGVEDAADLFVGATVEAVLAELQGNISSEETARTTADNAILSDLAADSTAGKGATLVGVYDVDGKFVATTVEGALAELADAIAAEITNRTNALAAHETEMASTEAGKGASLVGINDVGNLITAATVEAALQEIFTKLNTEVTNRTNADTAIRNDFASTSDAAKGAVLVGINDVGNLITATTVEGALQELASGINANDTALRNDLASQTAGKGASLVGIEDAAGDFTATTVEAALAELHSERVSATDALGGRMTTAEGEIDALEAAIGSATGLAGMDYTSTNYVTADTTVVAAISALDSSLKSLSDLAGNSDLQTAYANSAAHAPDGHARIKLATGKDLRFVDDTDDSVYFMVDSETGNVVVTGNLTVAGNTVQVDSTITEFENQQIKTGLAGTVGLDIRPGANYTAVPSETLATGDGGTTTFSGTLANTNVKDVVITDSIETFTDNGAGQLTGDQGGVGTINYATGAYEVTFNTAPAGAQNVNAGYGYEDGYVTPTADLVAVRSNAAAGADFRVDSSGQAVANKEIQANAGVNVTGNITITGTVDGVDVSSLKAAHDGHLDGGSSKHDATEIDYEGGAGSNYLTTQTNVEGAINTLDGEVKSINDAIGGAGGSSLSDQISALQGALGSSSGLPGMDYTSVNYVTADTTVIAAVSALDSQAKANADAIAAEIANRTSAMSAHETKMASTAAGEGASLVGVEDAAGKFTAATVEAVLAEIQANVEAEATARATADTSIRDDFGATTAGKGANLVGVEDAASVFTATTVEGVLKELADDIAAADSGLRTDLASNLTSKGASLVGVEDAAGKFTATTVEGVLGELQDNVEAEAAARAAADTAIRTDLASTANAKGASLIGVEDAAAKFNAATVEGALEELSDRITNSTHVYTTVVPATSHVVEHNFGQKYCNVTVIDATDNMVIPQAVVFNSANQLTVSFNSAIDCTVVCSR